MNAQESGKGNIPVERSLVQITNIILSAQILVDQIGDLSYPSSSRSSFSSVQKCQTESMLLPRKAYLASLVARRLLLSDA